jgi:AcrR family transcriptional regulator
MPGKRASEDVRREQILRAAYEVGSREGIASLTIRAVAAEAELSHALVLFHFQRKERLVHELLDWVIASTPVLHVSPEVLGLPSATDRVDALLRQEMSRLAREPRHTRLFLEFWALGARDEAVRTRISAELERYRNAFHSMMDELVSAEPAAFAGVTADGLAAMAVSWIHGCAVQAMIDPEHFDTGEYLDAVRGMVHQLAATSR